MQDDFLPPVYTPEGFEPLKLAVVRLAEEIYPELRHYTADGPASPVRSYLTRGFFAVGDFLRTRRDFDPYCKPPEGRDADLYSVRCFIALARARDKLRSALAEGRIVATGRRADGELMEVPKGYWQTDDGWQRLTTTDRLDTYVQIFLALTASNVESPAPPAEKETPSDDPSLAESHQQTRRRGKIEEKKMLREILDRELTEAPRRPKAALLDELKRQFPNLRIRASKRIWAETVKESGSRYAVFTQAGRPRARAKK